MQHNNNIEEKTIKTAQLVGLANLVCSPLLLINSQVGLVALIAMNSYLIYSLHGLGKSRRPGANALTKAQSLFSSQTNTNSNEIENGVRNIINGGAALHDEVTAFVAGASNSYRR
jgi:hypothetical protein